MHVRVPFAANLEPSECMNPSQGTFDNPTRLAETTATRRAELGKQERDAMLAQGLSMRLEYDARQLRSVRRRLASRISAVPRCALRQQRFDK